MFTEYIFNNKEYDVGVRNLKATMFDIVANEEANMAVLQEKFINEGDEDLQKKLLELSQSQSACLGNIVQITNALVENMQQLDSYSKQLNQIEQESVDRRLASVAIDKSNAPQNNELLQAQQSEPVVESVSTNAITADVANPQIDESKSENVVQPESDVVSDNTLIPNNSEVMESSLPQMEVINAEEIVQPAADNNSESVEIPNAQESIEDSLPQIEEINAEEVVPPAVNNISDGNDPSEPVDVADNSSFQLDGVNSEEAVSPVIEIAPESNDVSEQTNVADNSQSQIDETNSEETASPVIEITPESNAVSEQADVADNSQSQIDEANSEETASPVIEITPESNADSEDAEVIENSLPQIEETNHGETVPRVSETNSDGNVVTETVELSANTLPEIESDTGDLTNANEPPVIEADSNSNDASPIIIDRAADSVDRAILITPKQSNNLRNSRESQSQVVNKDNIDVTEEQLVANGLLEPSIDDKKKQIEAMLENANLLYKQGKIQESQALYDEISVLNKELQEQDQNVLGA